MFKMVVKIPLIENCAGEAFRGYNKRYIWWVKEKLGKLLNEEFVDTGINCISFFYVTLVFVP